MLLFIPPTHTKRPDWLWIQAAFYSVATEVLPQGVMEMGCEASHLSSSSVKVNYAWGYTTAPTIYCHDVHRGNFTSASDMCLIRDVIHCQ
jgi:hypothetical protein